MLQRPMTSFIVILMALLHFWGLSTPHPLSASTLVPPLEGFYGPKLKSKSNDRDSDSRWSITPTRTQPSAGLKIYTGQQALGQRFKHRASKLTTGHVGWSCVFA